MLAAYCFAEKIGATYVYKSERNNKQRAYAEKNISCYGRRGNLTHFSEYAEKCRQCGALAPCGLYSVNYGKHRTQRLGGGMTEISAYGEQ